MERKVLQRLLGSSIARALTEANVPLDGNHRRRLVRCLLRAAARLVLDTGAPVALFVGLAVEAAAKEARTEHPAQVPAVTNRPELLN